MVVQFRRSFGALIFALAHMLAAGSAGSATAEDRGAIHYRRGAEIALSGIDSPGPIAEVTVVNLQLRDFKLGCVSCGVEQRMLTAALDRRSAMRRSRDVPQRVRRQLEKRGSQIAHQPVAA